MKTTTKMIAILVLGGCASEDVAPAQRLPNAAKPLNFRLKDVLLSRQHILENGNTTHSPNGDAWSFRPDGTFTVAALTGQKSWSAKGNWTELPNGSIVLNGVESNERQPNPIFALSTYKRTLVGYSIVEKTDESLVVRFHMLGEFPEKADAEGK